MSQTTASVVNRSSQVTPKMPENNQKGDSSTNNASNTQQERSGETARAADAKVPALTTEQQVNLRLARLDYEIKQRDAEIKTLEGPSDSGLITRIYEWSIDLGEKREAEAKLLREENIERSRYRDELATLSQDLQSKKISSLEANQLLATMRERYDGATALKQKMQTLADVRKGYDECLSTSKAAVAVAGTIAASAVVAIGAVAAGGAIIGAGATEAVAGAGATASTVGAGVGETTLAGGAATSASIASRIIPLIGRASSVISSGASRLLSTGRQLIARGAAQAGTVAQAGQSAASQAQPASNIVGRAISSVVKYLKNPIVKKSAIAFGATDAVITTGIDVVKGKSVGETAQDVVSGTVKWGTVGALMPLFAPVAGIKIFKSVEDGGRVANALRAVPRAGLPLGLAYAAEETIRTPINTVSHPVESAVERGMDVVEMTLFGAAAVGVLKSIPIIKNLNITKKAIGYLKGRSLEVPPASTASAGHSSGAGVDSAGVVTRTSPVDSPAKVSEAAKLPRKPKKVWPPESPRYDSSGNSLQTRSESSPLRSTSYPQRKIVPTETQPAQSAANVQVEARPVNQPQPEVVSKAKTVRPEEYPRIFPKSQDPRVIELRESGFVSTEQIARFSKLKEIETAGKLQTAEQIELSGYYARNGEFEAAQWHFSMAQSRTASANSAQQGFLRPSLDKTRDVVEACAKEQGARIRLPEAVKADSVVVTPKQSAPVTQKAVPTETTKVTTEVKRPETPKLNEGAASSERPVEPPSEPRVSTLNDAEKARRLELARKEYRSPEEWLELAELNERHGLKNAAAKARAAAAERVASEEPAVTVEEPVNMDEIVPSDKVKDTARVQRKRAYQKRQAGRNEGGDGDARNAAYKKRRSELRSDDW